MATGHTLCIPSLLRLTRGKLVTLGTVTGLAYAGIITGPTSSTHWTSSAFADTGPRLEFEWPAVNLALQPPYDTVQLQATLRTARGVVMHDTATVRYTTSDTAAISVSATGLVKTRTVTTETRQVARVIARVMYGKRILIDTALVQVSPQPLPAPLAMLSIHPQPGGLKAANGNLYNTQTTLPTLETFPYFATMATGNPATDTVCNVNGCEKYPLVVHLSSSDPSIVDIDESGGFYPFTVGRVILTASTIAYGVRKVDSLPFSIGYNMRGATDLYADYNKQPARLYTAQGDQKTIPFSVGLRLQIRNHADERVEVSIPDSSRGAHFAGWNGTTYSKLVDTITSSRRVSESSVTLIRFDSVGTQVIQYRGLRSGDVVPDTFTIVPYP